MQRLSGMLVPAVSHTALLGGLGVIAVLSAPGRAALGVPIEPFITDAQRAAMAELEAPVLGVKAGSVASRTQALLRLNEILRLADPFDGHAVKVGRIVLAQLNGADCATVLDAFIAAAKAGVAQGGYRVTDLSYGYLGYSPHDTALRLVLNGESTGTIPLNGLGAALLAAVRERNRCTQLAVRFLPQPMPAFNRVVAELAGEMDGAGYLLSGKPPPEPTLAGGLAYAASESGKFVASVAGEAAGAVASKLISSKLMWCAVLGLVAWKVL